MLTDIFVPINTGHVERPHVLNAFGYVYHTLVGYCEVVWMSPDQFQALFCGPRSLQLVEGVPQEGVIRFLDMIVKIEKGDVLWLYKP